MYIISKYNYDSENETIQDVVENYDILVNYINKLIELDGSLQLVQTIPEKPIIGHSIPILRGNELEYLIQRYEFVTMPSI